ncbi:D-amino-acid transaminase [Vagococcus humatus]|uniref:D-alanine aminotransferase n=1 Tax=Vagococcus humatus TaxID=1889241 RepID=A0A3S0AXD9_9ENTE|nr:D-amino-acid transaminase [Vagococcus humatus]RST89379.1 D-amino-acid transaminase [Vagococcus humatus]
MKVLYKNQLIDREQAQVIDIEDRGYQFGDGVYEVIRVYNGHTFTLKEHLTRLFESAKKIKLTIPYKKKEITALVFQLIQANQLTEGTVYLQITRGNQSPRQHDFHLSQQSESILTGSTNPKAVNRAQLQQGVKATLIPDTRWLHCDIKSLNLLVNLLANAQAHEQGATEGIFHRDEIVTEGSHSNVFIVKNKQVITHPANHLILNGITRQVILAQCAATGIQLEEREFTRKELLEADEVFFTSTSTEGQGITEIDGQIIGDGQVGPLTKQIQQLVFQEINKQCGKIYV